MIKAYILIYMAIYIHLAEVDVLHVGACVCVCVRACMRKTLLGELVCRFPQKWYLNLLVNGTNMIWMGRQRGAELDAGGADAAGWADSSQEAKSHWQRRSSLLVRLKETWYAKFNKSLQLKSTGCKMIQKKTVYKKRHFKFIHPFAQLVSFVYRHFVMFFLIN